MDPKNIFIQDFTYELPEEKIAKFPLAQRDASKLLVYRDKIIEEAIYGSLADYIPRNALLVFNNTKVVQARILFQKSTGAGIELFCLEPHGQYADIHTAMQQQGKVWWKCLVGGFSKWKPGQILQKEIGSGENKLILRAGYIQKLLDCFVIEFSWEPESRSFAEVLHLTGVIPLPPYLKREAEEVDRLRYQTIYARHEGSVAAPTAGLHFTDSLFDKLSAKNIRNLFVSLHVGAGTFKPVNSKTIGEHHMHAENIAVSGSVISDLLQNSRGPVIAVGTTSLRTIESLYWLGIKTILDPAITGHDLVINQWDPYVLQINPISVKEALSSLLQWLKKNQLQELITKTQLLIVPGYEFKITRTLITNFHQPQSTLLLLVAALIGDDWKKVYSYALHNNFRFLSYGDGCLLFGGRN